MQHNIKTSVEKITPEIASLWLSNNIGNRPKSRNHIKDLADAMTHGRWKINGDAIRFSGSKLIDGQHRLEAVCLSGCAIESIVVRGIDAGCFDCIDTGKKRTTADTLGCMGFRNTTRLAAMLVMIDRYVTSRLDRFVTYSNVEIEELIKKYPDAPNSLMVKDKQKIKGLVSYSVVDACRYLFSKKDQDAAEDFMAKVLKGASVTQDSPEYVLRERLISNSLSKSKLSKEYVMMLFIKAWNHRRSGTVVKCLKYAEYETAPVIA